jgi:hypothetical protein
MGFGPPPDLRRFVARRSESVAAQLAGKSRGIIPTMSFGPGGGPRPTRPGEILSPAARGELRLTDAQRRRLAELQKELDGKLDDLLTEGQRKQLREMRNRAPGGFGPPGGSGRQR